MAESSQQAEDMEHGMEVHPAFAHSVEDRTDGVQYAPGNHPDKALYTRGIQQIGCSDENRPAAQKLAYDSRRLKSLHVDN